MSRENLFSSILTVGLIIALIVPIAVSANSINGEKKSHMIKVGATSVYVEETGKGPTLIFLHDGLLNHEAWRDQVKRFSTTHHTVVYDRRGIGKSEIPDKKYSNVEDLRIIMDQIGVEKAALVAASAGGEVALDFALTYPARVEKLVLVGAVIGGFALSNHFDRRFFANLSGGDSETIKSNWIHDRYILNAPGDTPARRNYADILTRNFERLKDNNTRLISKLSPPALSRLHEIKIPTLALIGESDIPDVHAAGGIIQANIEGAKREIISNAGHLIWFEQPDQFFKSVSSHLKNGN